MLEIFTALLLVFGIAAGIDVPFLIKAKKWKDLKIYIVLWFIGFILNVLARIFDIDFAAMSDWFVKTIGYT
ncbi:MAG: hypothetical protein HPY66_1361 [Firmicutes bacterium]|nr:hypothetical protein [Bacillota bacterium]MDI6706862.1 hypothetical protein [Bacillota bacterium]